MDNQTPNNASGQQTINIQVPSTDNIASRRPLIPASFAIAIILFFFTFCDLKCGGQKIGSVTGINLVTGTELKDHDMFTGREIKGKEIPSSIWAIFAFGAAIIGLGAFLIKEKREAIIGTGAGLVGAGSLIILQFAIKNAIDEQAKGQVETDFQFPYWGALIALVVAGLISYLRMKKSYNFVVTPTPPLTVTPTNNPEPQVQQQYVPPIQQTQIPTPSLSEQIAPSVNKMKAFVSKNKRLLIGAVTVAAIGYGIYFFFLKFNPKFEGTWIDKKSEAKVLVIQKSGSDYFVTVNGNKLSAKLTDNQLIVDNERTIAIDKSTGTIVFLGEDYFQMDGSQFVGKWADRNRYDLMEISKKGDDFNVLWKSKADIYQPHEVVCKLIDGNLIGDYYGHKSNFKLKVAGNKSISFNVDPFAEFEPIRNEYFTPTQSVFIVSSGDAFVGHWSVKRDPSINVISSGSNYFVTLSLGQNKWEWSAYFNNEQLISQQSVDGNRPALKLVTEDSILLTNFYMMGSMEQGMKLESKTPNPTTNENVQSASANSEQSTSPTTHQNNSGAFYIISVAAVKTENQAKTKAAELKNNGNSSGYLWIPDYASLSGAQFYSVYIGPFTTQYDCEVATEAYKKQHPEAYGVLVSQDRKRVQINGIGKVTVTQK